MRLIDADKLKLETLEIKRIMAEKHKIPLSKTILDCILNIISLQPTVEERPKGEWVSPSNNPDFSNRDLFCDCSICGHTQMDEPNFCPDCGADMRGTENGRD